MEERVVLVRKRRSDRAERKRRKVRVHEKERENNKKYIEGKEKARWKVSLLFTRGRKREREHDGEKEKKGREGDDEETESGYRILRT